MPHQKGFARGALRDRRSLARSSAPTTTARSTTRPTTRRTTRRSGRRSCSTSISATRSTKNLYFGVGADNLFNTFPDRQTKDANISFGRFIYSRNVSQFGMNGGFYYGKLQLTFF